jgi:hypothetical protein
MWRLPERSGGRFCSCMSAHAFRIDLQAQPCQDPRFPRQTANMEPSQVEPPARPLPTIHWILICCWLLGLYLIGTSIVSAAAIASNWSYYHGLTVFDPNLNVYVLLAMWLLRLANGILLLIRSRWVILTMPAWIVSFFLYFALHNPWKELPSEFYFGIALQVCILSFAIWVHSRGYLKR